MKKTLFTVFALSLALPIAAQAQQRLNEQQLFERATARGVCQGKAVESARYVSDTDNRIAVTCSTNAVAPTADAAGFVPALGLLGLGGAGTAAAAIGIAAAAAAAGGGGATSDTQ